MEYKEFKITEDVLAGKGQRFLNYIIDSIIVYSIIFVLTLIIGGVTLWLEYPAFIEWTENITNVQSYLIYFAIMIPYFTLCEFYFSRSMAKFITKTMVVMEDGSRPELGTLFKRTLCRVIPFDGLSFLGSGRGWHDKISDTYVVQKDNFNESKAMFESFDEIGKPEDLN